MNFIAKLVTERELERAVQKFAPDLINAEGMARDYLKAGCTPGDAFEVYETRQVHVSTLIYMSDGTVERLTPEDI